MQNRLLKLNTLLPNRSIVKLYYCGPAHAVQVLRVTGGIFDKIICGCSMAETTTIFNCHNRVFTSLQQGTLMC